MSADNFEQKYNKFESIATKKMDRSMGVFITEKEVLKFLYLLNRDFQSDRSLIPNVGMGELALCAEKSDAYSVFPETRETIEECAFFDDINIITEDYLKADIVRQYSSIILFPPMGVRTKQGYSEVIYIEKSLKLLAENGSAIIIVPQKILTEPAFREMREKILCDYSLEAVFTLSRISLWTGTQCSIIIVRNKAQSGKIFMSLAEEKIEILYEGYKNGRSGFYVAAEEVYDRFDAYYYDPKYKEIRELIQRRDTVIAYIFKGYMIPAEERKNHGEYIIIKPQNISGGKLHFDDDINVYCNADFVSSNNRAEQCILKKGDILISTIGRKDWAVYHGEEDFAIANHYVSIIRGKQEYEEWLQLFFSTHTGIDAIETQLRFMNHGSFFNNISIRGLIDLYVPDIKLMKTAERIDNAADLEAKVAFLFKELGWYVEEGYVNNGFKYDLALLENGQLKGIVEVKTYEASQIENNSYLSRQLFAIKQNIGELSLYLFVDDYIYEYIDGTLKQIPELPRPGKKQILNKVIKKEKSDKEIISIEKENINESSIADRTTMELILRGIEEIKASTYRIEDKVDNLTEKIEVLSKQILGYQSLVEKQLELAITPEEEERIIHAFSEECAERIIREVGTKNSEKEYNIELNKLIISFGEDAWNKMDESSRTFLVSSKVIFNNLEGLEDIVDYSGVCLLVTKALEVEISKRFCRNYLSFLRIKYPGRSNYALFPTPLIDQYGKPIRPKHFTLGSVAYVLCYLKADDLTESREENNKEKLIEYSREKLLSGKTDDEIMDILHDYAESIEEVRKDYRNPSAHTNELKKVDAEQCFALVVDVEKLMKRILDSFDE